MPSTSPAVETRSALLGRDREFAAIKALIDQAMSGQSGALVLRGEAGIGKTALLREAAAMAGSMQVLSAIGIEQQTDLAYAGLYAFLKPLLHHVDQLPATQCDALSRALGMASGQADRFKAGLGAMTLLAHAADPRGILCIIDDAQWLDSESLAVLAFIARRLEHGRVAWLFSVRISEQEPQALNGIAQMTVPRLSPDDSNRLLQQTYGLAGIGGMVRRRIVREAAGNPLALLEFSRSLSSEELAGAAALPEALTMMSSQLESRFAERIRSVPKATQTLLVLAAVERNRDHGLFVRAARTLGLPESAAVPAEEAGLLEREGLAVFRHPLVRSAVYREASPADRAEAHRAWAAVLGDNCPERRVWHAGQAATEPNEEVASELERSAIRARMRDGCSSEAQFLERAAQLSPDASARARRMLMSASAHYHAGHMQRVLALIREMPNAGRDLAAQAIRLKGKVAWGQRRMREACAYFLQAAEDLLARDRRAAQDTYIEAFECAVISGHLDRTLARDVARAAARATAKAPQTSLDWLLAGLCQAHTNGITTAFPALRQACARVIPEGNPLVGRFCDAFTIDLWDEEALRKQASWRARELRDRAALAQLPVALHFEATWCDVLQGKLAAAAVKLDEADGIFKAMGYAEPFGSGIGALSLASWRGDPSSRSRARSLIDEALSAELGFMVAEALLQLAIFEIGAGDFSSALAAASEAWAKEGDILIHGVAILPTLVEAAVACGDMGTARTAVEHLARRTAPCETKWASGTIAATRALIAKTSEVEPLYRQAIADLAQTGIATALARAHLSYGTWLRRNRRRLDARDQLRIAHRMFARMGAAGFARRAADELAAAGYRPNTQVETASYNALTHQERRVAELAAEGLATAAIAARLYLSPFTIKFHLKNVFAKLGVTSRTQLHAALDERPKRGG